MTHSYATRRFREIKTFSERCKLSKDLIDQYPNCVPVIVERSSDEKRLPIIDKRQYLVPHEMSFGAFFTTIRKRICHVGGGLGGADDSSSAHSSSRRPLIKGAPRGTANIGVWLYAGKTPITSPSSKMSEIYHYYKDNDGFLYLQYKGENVFGC